MHESKSARHLFFASLTFSLGAAIGCTTYTLCSESAVLRLREILISWYARNGVFAPFASDMLIVLLVLLFCASSVGSPFILILDILFGFCLALKCSVILTNVLPISEPVALFLLDLASVLPVLRISSLGMMTSRCFTRLWRSGGKQVFDLHPIIRLIWLSLMALFILLPIRCLLSALILP